MSHVERLSFHFEIKENEKKENRLMVVVDSENGPLGTRRYCDYDDFVKALCEKREGSNISTGYLPPNVLAIKYFENTREITVFIPAGVRTFYFNRRIGKDQVFSIPYPPLVTRISVNEQGETALCTQMWALKEDGRPVPETELYRFPFGNVSVDGHVCMGGNFARVSPKAPEDTINACIDLFFEAPYNGDYFAVGKMVMSTMTLDELLDHLHGKAEFEKKLLVPSEKKLADVIG